MPSDSESASAVPTPASPVSADGRYARMAAFALAALALATFAIYWRGLTGPFLLDDGVTFPVIERWLAGQASYAEAVLGRGSPWAGRPVAMASFALNAALGGFAPFSFKLGNLLIHLLCGVLVWQLLRRLLALDPRLSGQARLLATIASGLWLLHPIQVSTVLYSVQRMAQLSTMLVLAAVLVYVLARQELAAGQTRPARSKLFLTFPLLVLLGLLSKQNAAVAPLLCTVVEWGCFKRDAAASRPLRAFFGVFLLAPAALALLSLAVAPQWLLGGYSEWAFTLPQRLLSEPRALMAYLGQIVLPHGPSLGLYTDDFATSTGLLSPVSTLSSIVALVAISVAAWAWRAAAPSACVGWFFFLAAHAVESTFLPVELYYEHRNYLPLAGLALAAVGLTALLPERLQARPAYRLQVLAVAALAIVSLAAITASRVSVWRSMDTIASEGLREHPQSLRARYDFSGVLLARGDLRGNIALMQNLAASPDLRQRWLGRINLITARCRAGQVSDRGALAELVAQAPPSTTVFDVQALRLLARFNAAQGCGFESRELAAAIVRVLDAMRAQPESSRPKWLLRLLAAEIYAGTGDLAASRAQAERAWTASGDLPTGTLLAKVMAAQGADASAIAVLGELERRMKPYDSRGQAELAAIRAMLAAP
ncbi:hypothetical protein LVB77_18235 [Lysobacter sp. 5GHs7-4]|uniref:tetratricopeptide repeat protein n=1 Tax=Lysobacter sp. 5GHs7-4 TaxID=2904253 RepID=UPI001E2C541E|nr:hypothetical protein [Lysobacter sp. 5GHs7-4]UHQ22568.1 hypothetical protein LVB77_18235 [Lysobacter sp. 5GHs7-4]